MKMAYNGPQAVLDVPAVGLYGVARGEVVEIDNAHIRGRLADQGWDYVHEDDEDENKDGDNS